jgi:hypothetical protein
MATYALSGCAGSSRNKSVNAQLEQTQTDFQVLFEEYAQLARELSELPACPNGRDDLWANCFGTILTPDGSRYTGEVGHIPGVHSYQENFRTVHELGGKRVYLLGWPGFYQDRFGKRSGIGVYESAGKRYGSVFFDRYLYFGQWANSLKHGFGRFHSYDGSRYVGFYERDKRSGEGVEFDVNGNVRFQGRWENNKLASIYSLSPSLYPYTGLLSLPKPTFDGLRLRYVFESSVVAVQPKDRPKPSSAGEISTEEPSVDVIVSEPDADGIVTLSITTTNDIKSLRVNGDEVDVSADGRYNGRRFAQIGETQFEVIATDRFGNTKKNLVSVFRDAVASTVKFPPLNPSNVRGRPSTDAVAIIIGIQDYRRVPKAEFANNDARLFYDYAVRGLGVKPENIKLLLDQEADDVGILGAIQNWLPLKARKGQTDVYVFYSGHGLPSDDGASLYLLPHGVDRQFLDRTAIKQSELVSALQAGNPKSVTLFMDACYSGQIRTGETLLASARPISIQPKASTFPSNFTVLSASAPEQIASSSPDLKHGIFSYYLMKGMEGEADLNKDGRITVEEMQSYLKEAVGRKAMALNRTQQPQVVGDPTRDLLKND